MKWTFDDIRLTLKRYFMLLPDKADEQETIAAISAGVSFRGANLWVLVFAIFIASLGLNVNSTAVIIGAMLISPLMGPIIGMGLAVGTGDVELLKRALKNFLVATFISILTATLYFTISPLSEAKSELLARTTPSLYDVLIAFFGGFAGIVAQGTNNKGNVIPGVAIATALMPPLCTAGFGLGTGNWHYFLGAFYLYYINAAFICLATVIGVKVLQFHKVAARDEARAKKVRYRVAIIAILTLIPAAITTQRMVRNSVYDKQVATFVDKEVKLPGVQVLNYEADHRARELHVVTIGAEITDSMQHSMVATLPYYKLNDYSLRLIQSSSAHMQGLATEHMALLKDYDSRLHAEMQHSTAVEDSLNYYTSAEVLAQQLSREVSALWPGVAHIALGRACEVPTDSLHTPQHYTAVVVGMKKGRTLSHAERQRLQQWLAQRVGSDNLRMYLE